MGYFVFWGEAVRDFEPGREGEEADGSTRNLNIEQELSENSSSSGKVILILGCSVSIILDTIALYYVMRYIPKKKKKKKDDGDRGSGGKSGAVAQRGMNWRGKEKD